MMSGWLFIIEHGVDLVSALGIGLGLYYTSLTLRADMRSRRVTNLISLTQQHREIWESMTEKPALKRVVQEQLIPFRNTVTESESQFVVLVILHVYCWYRAINSGEVSEIEGFSADLREFFTLPIPREVWNSKKRFYDHEFVSYIDGLIWSG